MALPGFLVPDFKLVTQSRQHHALVETGEFTQARWNQDATASVHLEFGGMTQQHALQRARALVLVGQADEFALDLVPVGKRVEQQATVVVDGQYDTPLAAFVDRRTVT